MSRTTILFAVIGGLASALFNLSPLLGGLGAMVLSNLNALPLFLVGLSLGAPAVIVAAIVATATAGLVGGLTAAVAHAVASGVPAIILCQKALMQRENKQGQAEWYPLGHLCLWLVGIGAVYYGFLILRFSPQLEGLGGFFDQYLATAENVTAAERQKMIHMLAAMVPVALPAFWMLAMIVDGVLAQMLLRRFHRNIRPSAALAEMYLPGAAAVFFLVGLILVFLPDPLGGLGRALVGLMLIAYFLQGLAVLHALSRRWPMRGLFLGGVYLLVILTGWLAMIAMLVGLLEHLIPFRKRAARGAAGARDDEEE